MQAVATAKDRGECRITSPERGMGRAPSSAGHPPSSRQHLASEASRWALLMSWTLKRRDGGEVVQGLCVVSFCYSWKSIKQFSNTLIFVVVVILECG